MVRRHGFALLEVIVALTLLGLALLGVTGSTLLATRILREAEGTERGALEALQTLDSLVHVPAPGNGQRRAGRIHLSWQVTRDSTGVLLLDVTASWRDGAAERTAYYRLARAGQP